MTIEQFIVGSIFTIVTTAAVIWQFLFMPRLHELEEQRLKWQARAEVAEAEMRTNDEDSMKLVGNHDWGTAVGHWDALREDTP